MIDLGFYELYKRKDLPEDHPWRTHAVLFARSINDGTDWYDFLSTAPSGTYVLLDEQSIVCGIEANDPSAIFPAGYRIVIVDPTVVVSIGDVMDANGNFSTPEPRPQRINMRQVRLALHANNMLDKVLPYLDKLKEPERSIALIEWEYATVLSRGDPIILQLATALNLDEAAIDALFLQASQL